MGKAISYHLSSHQSRLGTFSLKEQFRHKEHENRLVGRLLIKSQYMVTAAFQLRKINNESLKSLERNIQIVTLIFFITLILTSTITSLLIYRRIAIPIRKLEKGINFIGGGNLDHRVDTKTKDEIGQLSSAFDQMSQKLEETNQNLHSEIHEHSLVNEKLLESRLQYKTVADFTYDWETWIDPDGNYLYISPSCERISGYKAEAFIENPDLLINITHPEDKQLVINHFHIGESLSSLMHPIDFRITKKNGDTVWISHACLKVRDAEGNILGRRGSNRDITEQKANQKELEISLYEKETLMQEIHHRVKNNMTVISSLLKLQMASVTNEKAKEALQDSQNRVQTMSMIHETLYRSDNLSAIDMKTYLSELGRIILQGYNFSGKVSLKIETESILIGVKQASPLGLIVNELITNSFKYAFPGNRKGEIVLKLKSNKENEAELAVSDDGVGIPEEFDLDEADSLGLKLVKTIAENQLDGSIDIENDNGTKFIIKFNIET